MRRWERGACGSSVNFLRRACCYRSPEGVLGVAAGYVGIRVLLGLSPGNIPRIGPDGSHVVLDWRVLGFALALSMLTRHSVWTRSRLEIVACGLEQRR